MSLILSLWVFSNKATFWIYLGWMNLFPLFCAMQWCHYTRRMVLVWCVYNAYIFYILFSFQLAHVWIVGLYIRVFNRRWIQSFDMLTIFLSPEYPNTIKSVCYIWECSFFTEFSNFFARSNIGFCQMFKPIEMKRSNEKCVWEKNKLYENNDCWHRITRYGKFLQPTMKSAARSETYSALFMTIKFNNDQPESFFLLTKIKTSLFSQQLNHNYYYFIVIILSSMSMAIPLPCWTHFCVQPILISLRYMH